MAENQPVTFYSRTTGAAYTTSDQAEINRLKMSHGHSTAAPELSRSSAPPFDPAQHSVAEVKSYLDKHPADYERVMAAERSGQKRAGLVGHED